MQINKIGRIKAETITECRALSEWIQDSLGAIWASVSVEYASSGYFLVSCSAIVGNKVRHESFVVWAIFPDVIEGAVQRFIAESRND
jgi:hypothetical protein